MGQTPSTPQQTPERIYGWKRDRQDSRDHRIYFDGHNILTSKLTVDIRPMCPPVYDQGNLGSCSANAICGAFQFDELKQSFPDFIPSRLFVYWNERNMEGTVDTDSGATLRDGMKTINKQGVCKETIWTYDISKFKDKPTDESFMEAKEHRSVAYKRLTQDISQMKACLSEELPFVFGFMVYESFETIGTNGIMPIPKSDEKCLGGHAVMAVGYDDQKEMFIIRNSWGKGWGDHGYFYMPYAYIRKQSKCEDFWVLQRVVDMENEPTLSAETETKTKKKNVRHRLVNYSITDDSDTDTE